MSEMYAVVGKTIIHSKSPMMYNAAFKAERMDAVYVRLASKDADDALQTAKEMGLKGLNITSPYKEELAGLVDSIDESGKEVGAINTVIMSNGNTTGYNTDTYGVVKALVSNGIRLKGRKCLVIGAGGAARAAIASLLNVGVKITVANRTEEKAEVLARTFSCSHVPLEEKVLKKVISDIDMVVSCANASELLIPPRLLGRSMVVLDANYSSQTDLVRGARRRGCRVIDGREWLLFQGTRAFELFTGKRAPISIMRKAVYSSERDSRKENIALIGFMGSGKSTVAREISRQTRRNVIDIDSMIERKAGRQIKSIFLLEGEGEFRRMEREEVKKTGTVRNSVIACGGGVVLEPDNVENLKKNCMVVWLWATPESAFRRIRNESSRPLLNVENREKVAGRMIAERLQLYANASDMMVSTERKEPEEVARLIIDESNKNNKTL